MSEVLCKRGHKMYLMTPDYGRGSEWVCYTCDPYGKREIRTDKAAREYSDSARSTSRQNAALITSKP